MAQERKEGIPSEFDVRNQQIANLERLLAQQEKEGQTELAKETEEALKALREDLEKKAKETSMDDEI